MENESKNWRKRQQKFYKSNKWLAVREQVILRDKNFCQICGQFIRGRAYVHHIKELNASNIDDPKIALNKENLITTCFECHEKEHPDRLKKEKEKEVIVDNDLNIDYSKRKR